MTTGSTGQRAADGSDARAAVPLWAVALGAAFLLVSAAMSLMLVLEHLGGMSLPGCGAGSPCAQVTSGFWGKIRLGGFEWPVSYLGLAYFLAALVTWVATRGAGARPFAYLVRLGALASLGFCTILLLDRLLCPYCLASHAGNFAFWITLEATRSRAARTPRQGLTFASVVGVFVLATAGLGVSDGRHRAAVRQKAEEDYRASLENILRASRRDTPTSTSPSAVPQTTRSSATTTTTTPKPPVTSTSRATRPTAATTATSQSASQAPAQPFTGRYRQGPERAAIRIVMFTDYQCPDCRQLERQASEVLKECQDVSLSVKHFPFCPDCNSYVTVNLHKNACWAARAAEAAGILWGNDGFWKMHDWLFEHQGMFETTEQLEAGIREMGYDPAGFVAAMSGNEPLRRMQADIKEAVVLGLHFTPMIFINGVEFKGWTVPNALKRMVADVAATNPPPRTAADDHPPAAVEKYVADWRDQKELTLPPDNRTWRLGPEGARVRIVVWGDYQESGTAEADAIIRAFVTSRTDAQYTFRHYPFNSDCNPSLPFQRHPLACWASRAAEAAGTLGGNDAYWRMHAWLMEHYDGPLKAAATELNVGVDALRDALYTMKPEDRQKAAAKLRIDPQRAVQIMQRTADTALRAAAAEMGLDADKLLAAMGQPDVNAAITEDVDAGKKLPVLRYGTPPGIHGIPSIFINDRYVPRWQLEGQTVLERILAAAAAE